MNTEQVKVNEDKKVKPVEVDPVTGLPVEKKVEEVGSSIR